MIVFLAIQSGIVFGQKTDRSMDKLIQENFVLAAEQYKLLGRNTPPDVMPRNYVAKESKLVTSNTSWWTSGFFPVLYGMSMNTQRTRPYGQKRSGDWLYWKI